jgi:hypothetical protein
MKDKPEKTGTAASEQTAVTSPGNEQTRRRVQRTPGLRVSLFSGICEAPAIRSKSALMKVYGAGVSPWHISPRRMHWVFSLAVPAASDPAGVTLRRMARAV